MEILVLASDLMERSVIQQVLQYSGHQVTFTNTADETWRRIKEGAFRFIILDAEAQVGGVQPLIEKIRTATHLGRAYIILLTSKGHNTSLVTNLGVEADDYLVKPVSPQELKARALVGARILSLGDDLQQARSRIDNVAMYDTLTGVLNRQAFYKFAQGELERARRLTQGISVIAIQVDNFRSISDSHGVGIANDMLQIISQIIREKSRPYDCIGRWEDALFVIALPGIMSNDAEKVARRIIHSVKTSHISMEDGSTLNIQLNAGIATNQTIKAYAEIDALLQGAIQAMRASPGNAPDQINVIFI
ncbi:MAG: hypothetical protein Fur0043_24210 [Anaerolineales bacterium]